MAVGMWPYFPDLLATPVPRYTSYPTAADFDDMDARDYESALESAQGDVSLYVHIPFCEKICFYCGCNTAAAGKRQRLESYLHALNGEIDLVAERLPKDARIRRISFGGGSPNAIESGEFAALVDRLTNRFQLADPVLSIELDPRSMTADWAKTISQVGIERASLGIQTFAEHCQQAIGRVQPEDSILLTVDLLRGSGIESLNFDLMYGLPGQSREDLLDTLRRARILGADRIALFGYAHVPHIVPRQRAIDDKALPDQAERFAMAALGFSYLVGHGYSPIGFDHFAKSGHDPLAYAALSGRLRRNFQGFTDDDASVLIGLGSSAISSFPQLLAQNDKNSGRYRMLLSQGRLPTERGIRRTTEDRLRSQIIQQLLCEGYSRLPDTLLHEISKNLAPFIDRGLASLADGQLTVLPDGLPYARTVASLFDTFRHQSTRNFSSAI